MSKTIIVSNRLPVKITEKEGEYVLNPSEGGLATGLGSIYRQGYNIWIGWPGVDVNEAAQGQIKEQLGTMNLMPVYLTQDEINNYYEGFSNEVLWPVFHYMSVYARYEQVYWDYYYQVNTKFRDAVLEVAEPGDIIWIHDYQLLLLPGMIRAAAPDVAIGYFQHIPFPSFELFRLIPWRVELLEGMLGADLLGFHTFDDSHHFLNAVTRLLPLNANANVVTVNDRAVVAETFPMGIDNGKFELLAQQDPEVLKQVQNLRENFQGTHMVLSIDRLDYSKGILQRLQAFELFLQLYPEYIEKVVLYMIVVPSRDTVAQYKELRDAIDMLAGGINARFRTLNWHPINYFYRSFPVETLSALYSFAHVGLVTPMRDGMNLVSKEYVASRKDSDGVLILSEMAGASKELIDALIVNPNNIGAIARAIHEALNMPEGEQRRRMKQMQQIVSKFNISHWVKLFMARLQEVKQLQQSMLARRMSLEMQVHVRKDYKGAKERAIFLDYDGTLVGFQTNIDLASPDQDLIQLLTELTADPLNRVVMVSGRKYQTLEEWLGHLKLDLIAEHGAFHKKQGEEWQQLPGLTDVWKADIAPILETFTDRTPGSFIEEKSFSLVWHYRKAEAGLGELRANELMNTLRYFAADKGLQLLPGDKVIEVKNVEINKGKATLAWLQNRHFDFTLAIGDDHTDEDIFKALPQSAVTIKVGSQLSAARFYLRNHREVRAFLKSLILV